MQRDLFQFPVLDKLCSLLELCFDSHMLFEFCLRPLTDGNRRRSERMAAGSVVQNVFSGV